MATRTASCSCGQLKAEVNGDALRISICHCVAAPRISIYEERMHNWVVPPAGAEHIP